MRLFRIAPITAGCIVVCAALFVVTCAQSLEGFRFRDVQRAWGANMSLQLSPIRDEMPGPIHRQLHGPFDLWDGQWWRIPLSAFHHGDLFHLLFNCCAAWIVGSRLERRWGSLRYGLFMVPAILFPLLLESLFGNCAIGFSGAICAILGALIVLQEEDPWEDDLMQESILISLGFILAGIPLAAFDFFPIANPAHIGGIAYGWAAASLLCRSGSGLAGQILFVLAHLLLIPGYWLAMHPLNDGRYLWYLADRDRRIPPEEREPMLKLALETDPSLTGIWLRLAEHRLVEGQTLEAWKTLIQGLSFNPADSDLFEEARRVWRQLSAGPERDIAEAELKRTFGDQASLWSHNLRESRVAVVKPGRRQSPSSQERPLNPKDFPLDAPIDLHWEPKLLESDSPPPINPDDPGSAAEGFPL